VEEIRKSKINIIPTPATVAKVEPAEKEFEEMKLVELKEAHKIP
jgi:hypothetical protein